MKLSFYEFAGRLRAKTVLFLIGLILAPVMALGTQSIYINNGTITGIPPVVDATNFYNTGTWYIFTDPYPYQTAHTLNYTNSGTMTGSVGWEFDYGPTTGGSPAGRVMSASFFNDNSGTIQAVDGTIVIPPNNPFPTTVSYLLVSATNIVNDGTLIAGANGEIVLNGGNVALARSDLEILPISGTGSSNSTNSFTPDASIYDELWQTNVLTINGSPWDGTNVYEFTFINTGEPCGISNATISLGPVTPQIAEYYTTSLYPYQVTLTNSSGNPGSTVTLYSNIIRQASFVAVSDPNISASNHFSPALSPTNYFKTVAVQFAMTATNVVTRAIQTNYLYMVDDLGSSTNLSLLKNSLVPAQSSCTAPSYRPSSVILSRSDPVLSIGPAFASGVPGTNQPPLPSTFFYDSTFSNFTAVGFGDLYSASVDNLPPATNSGRININAGNLDLSRTRMRAESQITIQATNLIGSQGAVIDCQNLSYNLGSATGLINVTNLVSPSVSRFHGTVTEWSGVWTNYMLVILNNYAPVTEGGSTNWVESPLTNLVQINLALTVVDGTGLSSTAPTTVQDLVLSSTNMVVSDSLNVVDNLLFSGSSLTLNGQLTLSGNLQEWDNATAPTLRYFTNTGSLLIPNQAHFGDDTALPYAEFFNSGQIQASSVSLRSLDFQIVGTPTNFSYIFATSGDFLANVQSAELSGVGGFAGIYSEGNTTLNANTLLMQNLFLYSARALNFTVTNSLSDNGSTLYCYNGFNLNAAPQTGNLSGTTINSFAPGDKEVNHAWAGVDYGPSGWSLATTSNAPIGTLVLSAEDPSQLPTFHFYGTGGAPSNAMYVTTLVLTNLTDNPGDLTSMIQIDPGMKIYFSTVVVSSAFSAALGGQTPADYLQSQFPGQFVTLPNTVVTQSGSVNWNTTYQTIDGFGASSAWQSTWTTNEADMFFSTNSGTGHTYNGTNFTFTGIGLSLLRNHIQYANTPLASDTPTTVETNIMLWAQQRGARVWSSPWTPAAGFKSIDDIYDGNTATGGGINGGSFQGGTATNQAYASQLANYVLSMKNLGINLYAISIQNEPDANVTSYEACQWSGQEIHDFVTNLYNALVAKGVGPTRIMIPEGQSWQGSTNLYTATMSDPAAAADVGIIADHNYNTIPPSGVPIQQASSGLPAWETETANLSSGNNSSIAEGMYWANRIYLFMTVAQANAWHFWWLMGASSSGYDNSNQGLTDTNGVPTKRMYVLGQFSRFVRPGYERISANTSGSDLLVAAFKATNSQSFAIVAINTNASIDVNQTFNLNNFPAVSTVTPWITSATNSLAVQPAVTVSGSSFTYTIPAQSIMTFVNGAPSNITISSTSYPLGGHSFVLTWNSTAGATYSVLKTNILGGSAANWPAIVTGYPTGGAAGGSLSYTDTTATVGPAFYRVSSP